MEMPFSPSGALIKHPFAGLLLGEGPFRESAVPPESGAAFYVNTFRLDDPLPWKIPAALHSLPEPEDGLPPLRKSAGRPRPRTPMLRCSRK